MITEDYVSFETAKLLKEKGFREFCFHCYGVDVRHNGESISFDEELDLKDEGYGDEIEYVEGGQFYHCGCDNKDESEVYAAPSLYIAMKWLREVHNIFIGISVCERYENQMDTETKVMFFFELLSLKEKQIIDGYSQEYVHTYEEACKSAIRYCLENLI